VLQVAFDWTDSHLHRFSLGGHPFDNHSQLFLCPYDVEEGELEDDDGPPPLPRCGSTRPCSSPETCCTTSTTTATPGS
jgi:hypothetical protein